MKSVIAIFQVHIVQTFVTQLLLTSIRDESAPNLEP